MVAVPLRDAEIHRGGDSGPGEPGERCDGGEQRHKGADDGSDGRRGEGGDGAQVDAACVVVRGGGVHRVQLRHIDPALPDQPVVGDDHAEQRAEERAEAAQEVVDDGRVVVEVPRQDDDADHAADDAGPPEVEALGEEIGQRVGRGHEVGHEVHRDGENDQRQTGERQEPGAGDGLHDIRRAVDDMPVDPELRPGQHDRDGPEEHDVDGDAAEVADRDRLPARTGPGEVAEVQRERAVDGDPERRSREDLVPHLPAGQRVVAGQRDGAARLPEHPDGERGQREQDDRARQRLVLPHHFDAVHQNADLDAPQEPEGDPAEGRQAEEGVLGQMDERVVQRDQQDVQHMGREIRLDAEPRDGDGAADESRDLGAPDTEADTAHDRERDAGLLAHVPGQVEYPEEQRRADRESEQHLPGTEPEGEQACGERVVAQAVHVVGPQGEDVVAAPAAPVDLGGRQVVVVQPGAQRGRGTSR